jgi:hypothetical protein
VGLYKPALFLIKEGEMLKSIRIFSKQLELLAEIDGYESLIFTRKYIGYGEFEININRHKLYTEYLQKGNIILIGTSYNKIGIIKKIEITLDEDGRNSETINVFGYTLESLLYQRLIIPPDGMAYDKITSNAESVVKHYINKNILNSTDIERNISYINVLSNQNRGMSVNWSSRFKNLGEEIEKICVYSGIGTEVSLDYESKKFNFDVVVGKDLTTGQSENNPVIFSCQFDNIKSQKYFDTDLGYQNIAYVAGQGEGIDRVIEKVGTGTGLERYETFVDARDIDNADDLVDRGHQVLSETPQIKSLENEILTYGSFVYEKDWNIGDMVTVQNENWNITTDTRIMEVTEIYEPDGFQLHATFGNKIPRLIDKVKNEIGKINVEIMR